VAELAEDVDGVHGLPEGADASPVEESAESHDGLVVHGLVLANLVAGDQLVERLEDLLSGKLDIVWHPDEEAGHLHPGELSRHDALLDEHEALGAATHQEGIEEDVLERDKILSAGAELTLEFLVDRPVVNVVKLFLFITDRVLLSYSICPKQAY
jgi:hypothetical protein